MPHARRQEPLSMRQPKFKSWPAWHKRLQLAIHLESARAPFFFSSERRPGRTGTCRPGTDAEYYKVVNERACPATDELANLLGTDLKILKLQVAVSSAALRRIDEREMMRIVRFVRPTKQTRTSRDLSLPRLPQGFLDQVITLGPYNALSCYYLPGRRAHASLSCQDAGQASFRVGSARQGR